MNLKWACLQNWRCVQRCVSEKNAIQVTFLWSVSQEKTRHRTVPNMVSCWWKIPQWMFLLTDLSLLKYSRWKTKPLFVAIMNKTPVFVIWIPLSPETLWTHNPSPDDGGIRCSFQGKRVNILPLPLSVISSYFDCIKLGFTDILLNRFDAGMPRGLRLVLTRISKKKDETPEQCRRRAFKRLFGILWVCCIHFITFWLVVNWISTWLQRHYKNILLLSAGSYPEFHGDTWQNIFWKSWNLCLDIGEKWVLIS